VDRRTLTLARPQLAADGLSFFRWGRVAGKVLVSNDAGDWTLLSESELDDLLGGRVSGGHPRFQELRDKNFLREGLDLDAFAARVARRNTHVRRGPHWHVVTLTTRCTQGCAYCRTTRQSGENTGADLSAENAEKVVDLALQSSSASITFELQAQGGEPLCNFDVLRHLVEVARARNERAAGKTLRFTLVSNLTAMTEAAADWLIANDVLVCTSLDGPAGLHDANRKWKHGAPHAEVIRWIEYFNRRYVDGGRDTGVWHVDAVMTTTRPTLTAWREVVDEYVARGLRTIQLRPLNPAVVSREMWPVIGYSADEYLDFYRRALDYILQLNGQGVEITERTASTFLVRILTSEDPGIVDIQSPSGAGTAQIAYDVDGRVFPSNEARMVDAMGEPLFALGHVGDLTVADVLRHPTVRAIAAASLLDAQPMCADCWNKPFCGISPVLTFMTQGDLFGQRPRSLECKEHMGVSGRLFELLAHEGDARTAEILKRWTGSPVDRCAVSDAP